MKSEKQQKYERKLEKLTYVCKYCGKEYTPKSKNSKYCKDCRDDKKPHKLKRTWPNMKKGGGFIGALSELKVSIDLMNIGFEVYRNVSSHGSVDLIAYTPNKEIIAIEVTTGCVNEFTKKRYFNGHIKHHDRIDVLAVCYYDKIIYYIPKTSNSGDEIDISKFKK